MYHETSQNNFENSFFLASNIDIREFYLFNQRSNWKIQIQKIMFENTSMSWQRKFDNQQSDDCFNVDLFDFLTNTKRIQFDLQFDAFSKLTKLYLKSTSKFFCMLTFKTNKTCARSFDEWEFLNAISSFRNRNVVALFNKFECRHKKIWNVMFKTENSNFEKWREIGMMREDIFTTFEFAILSDISEWNFLIEDLILLTSIIF